MTSFGNVIILITLFVFAEYYIFHAVQSSLIQNIGSVLFCIHIEKILKSALLRLVKGEETTARGIEDQMQDDWVRKIEN